MPNVSEDALLKMKDYIRDRNNPTRLSMVELVARYVMEDLDDIASEDKEEALVLTRFHLSTDRGIEDMKTLYPDAAAWVDEGGLESSIMETK
jgi:hypothetical protein